MFINYSLNIYCQKIDSCNYKRSTQGTTRIPLPNMLLSCTFFDSIYDFRNHKHKIKRKILYHSHHCRIYENRRKKQRAHKQCVIVYLVILRIRLYVFNKYHSHRTYSHIYKGKAVCTRAFEGVIIISWNVFEHFDILISENKEYRNAPNTAREYFAVISFEKWSKTVRLPLMTYVLWTQRCIQARISKTLGVW